MNKRSIISLGLIVLLMSLLIQVAFVRPTTTKAQFHTSELVFFDSPQLSIPSSIPANPNSTVVVPVSFTSGGNYIASTVFSIDYDETWLMFDNTIPNAINFVLPSDFSGQCTPDISDSDGEIDCFILDPLVPLSSLPDGVVLNITLRTGNPSSAVVAKVGLPANSPATVFGNTSGQSVPGSTLDGSVTISTDQQGTLFVKKVIVNDNGGTLNADDFSFSVNGEPAVPFEPDGQNDLTVNIGTYNVVEPDVSGYSTTYDNCIGLSITNGGIETCTITNDDQPGTLIVKKVVVNDMGGTLNADDFSFSVNGDPTVPFEPDGQNELLVNVGTYNVVESAVAGYSTTYDNCTDMIITIGGTETCTITNTYQFDEPSYENFLSLIFGRPCTDYFDDFSDPTSGWFVGEDEFARYEYMHGEYRIVSKDSFDNYADAPTCPHIDYSVEVKARWDGISGESYGIYFGFNEQLNEFYLFEVSADYQDYSLYYFDGYDYQTIIPYTYTPIINSGFSSNQIRVTRKGNQIILVINNKNLGT